MGNWLSENGYGNEHKGCCCPVNNDTFYLVEFDHDDDYDYDYVVVDNNNNNNCNSNQNQWFNNNNANNVDSYGEFEVSLFTNKECHDIPITDEDTDTLPCYDDQCTHGTLICSTYNYGGYPCYDLVENVFDSSDVPCQDPLVTTLVIVGTYILSWIKR